MAPGAEHDSSPSCPGPRRQLTEPLSGLGVVVRGHVRRVRGLIDPHAREASPPEAEGFFVGRSVLEIGLMRGCSRKGGEEFFARSRKPRVDAETYLVVYAAQGNPMADAAIAEKNRPTEA